MSHNSGTIPLKNTFSFSPSIQNCAFFAGNKGFDQAKFPLTTVNVLDNNEDLSVENLKAIRSSTVSVVRYIPLLRSWPSTTSKREAALISVVNAPFCPTYVFCNVSRFSMAVLIVSRNVGGKEFEGVELLF